MTVDVLIVGGGPAGLSAALALGRARKRVLLCDAGPRRNAAATHIHVAGARGPGVARFAQHDPHVLAVFVPCVDQDDRGASGRVEPKLRGHAHLGPSEPWHADRPLHVGARGQRLNGR